jgi:hypothetical protein
MIKMVAMQNFQSISDYFERKTMRSLCRWTCGLLLFAATFTTQAGIIALWTFDGNSTDVNQSPVTLNTDPGYQNGASLSSAGFSVTGTPNGDPRTSGQGSPNYGLATGGTLTLQISGIGFSGYQLAYQALDGGSGTQSWQWSPDNSSWNSPVSASLPISGLGWSADTVDFSGASGSTIYFRNTIGGSIGFDNIQITAVPEPINYALATFGLCVGGISFGRRFVRKLSRA